MVVVFTTYICWFIVYDVVSATMSGPMDVAGLISLLESADIQAGREVKELVLDNLRNSMYLTVIQSP
jgi:hypothetical protein